MRTIEEINNECLDLAFSYWLVVSLILGVHFQVLKL